MPQEIHCHIAFICEEMGVSIEQFLKHAIMVDLHEMEMAVSDVHCDCKCSENIGADNNADMFEIYEKILEDIEKQVSKLGKVFFYRNIAAEIMFHDDGAWEGRLLNVSKECNFDAAERYVLLGVLVYTAPVAFAMGASQTTSGIFESWCKMIGGQVFLLIMNVWCLRIQGLKIVL